MLNIVPGVSGAGFSYKLQEFLCVSCDGDDKSLEHRSHIFLCPMRQVFVELYLVELNWDHLRAENEFRAYHFLLSLKHLFILYTQVSLAALVPSCANGTYGQLQVIETTCWRVAGVPDAGPPAGQAAPMCASGLLKPGASARSCEPARASCSRPVRLRAPGTPVGHPLR